MRQLGEAVVRGRGGWVGGRRAGRLPEAKPDRRGNPLPVRSVWEVPCHGVHSEAVVVAGDLDDAGPEVLHGLVHATVAVLHLVGAAAEGEGEQLMSEADTEDRN